MNTNQNTVWFIFYHDKLLMQQSSSQELNLPTNTNELETHFSRKYELGVFNNSKCYCAEIQNDCSPSLLEGYEPISLRQGLDILDPIWFTAISKAFSIINWDKNHQFCGRCGHITSHKQNTFERICTKCEASHFPRISPSIIVLIKKSNQILMARSPHFSPGVYGLIAGFVESGETIEEAVHREVKEEVNLKIKNISYFGSQFWPFPGSLMLGFTAEYEDGELQIDSVEIEDAGWYTIDNLPYRPSTSVSIAHKMISQFIADAEQK